MGDENPIRTLGDYSKPSPTGTPLSSPKGTMWCLIDPTPSVDSLDLNGDNRERTRLLLFQFSLHDQASNWLECLPAGSISIWEDLTTRFLAQFFLPGRTIKLRNDILMFQQHQGESLSEAWTRFNDLLQKVSHHGIDRWLLIQIFYSYVSFHLKCENDHSAGGKLYDKNVDESWEIIENLALYAHERWNDSKDFVKPVKAISTSQSTSKRPDQRLLELEDQINLFLKGSRPTPRPSSIHVPQAYVKAALGTTFKARVQDYIAAHTERIERFENAIFKQHEEINDRMAEMFGLLKELTASQTSKKVLVSEEARHLITKNVNSIYLIRVEEEKNVGNNGAIGESVVEPSKSEEEKTLKEVDVMNEVERRADDKPAKSVRENVTKNEEEEPVGVSSSHAVGYYLKHRINEKLIEGLIEN
ncbi:zinc finger, CCHC-type containing protein [Tanacetum coccineum]